MTFEFPIRTAVPSDASTITALVNSAYRGDSSRAGWTTEADLLGGQRMDEKWMREIIASEGSVVLLHERDQQIVASVHLKRTGDACYLGMITVKPVLQGSGLGAALLEASEQWARTTWQSRSVHMTVIVQRPELVAWYERHGYRRTGERKPFPYGDVRFGLPARPDLAFEVLRKDL
jgi:ribosomal protein S18 acetylase RimI-like enzyme